MKRVALFIVALLLSGCAGLSLSSSGNLNGDAPRQLTEGSVCITVRGAVAKPGIYGFLADESCSLEDLYIKMGPDFIVHTKDGRVTDVELVSISRANSNGTSQTFKVHLRFVPDNELVPLHNGDIVTFTTRDIVM